MTAWSEGPDADGLRPGPRGPRARRRRRRGACRPRPCDRIGDEALVSRPPGSDERLKQSRAPSLSHSPACLSLSLDRVQSPNPSRPHAGLGEMEMCVWLAASPGQSAPSTLGPQPPLAQLSPSAQRMQRRSCARGGVFRRSTLSVGSYVPSRDPRTGSCADSSGVVALQPIPEDDTLDMRAPVLSGLLCAPPLVRSTLTSVHSTSRQQSSSISSKQCSPSPHRLQQSSTILSSPSLLKLQPSATPAALCP